MIDDSPSCHRRVLCATNIAFWVFWCPCILAAEESLWISFMHWKTWRKSRTFIHTDHSLKKKNFHTYSWKLTKVHAQLAGPGVGGEFGPYRQSERNALYKQYVEKLLKSGNVYRCFCSNEVLKYHKAQCWFHASQLIYLFINQHSICLDKIASYHTIVVVDAGATVINETYN